MSEREKVAAYKAALELTGARELRMPMSTQDAVRLAGELKQGEARHPQALLEGVDAWAALGPAPTDPEAQIAYGTQVAKAADKFWNGFEQQVVDGVEIVRRR